MGMKTIQSEALITSKDVPGPGLYTPVTNSFSTIAFSLSGKDKGSITHREGPGPGEYQSRSVFSQITGPATFSRFKRIQKDKKGAVTDSQSLTREVPGPGAYKGNYRVLTRNDPQPIFGSSTRDKNTFYDTQTKLFPGPGTYNSKGTMRQDGKTITMSPRRPDTSPQVSKDTPGPGTYDQTKLYMTLKQFGTTRIGTSKRLGLPSTDKSIPGPQQYNVADPSFVMKKDPRTIFGSSERDSILNGSKLVPGPGTYLIPQKAIEGRQFSLSSRYKQDKPKDTPGPDAYNSLIPGLQTQKKQPSFVFGHGPKTARDLTSRRIVPGPGTYDLKNKSSLAMSFTQTQRLKVKYDENPGPGTYKLPVKFADVPKYLIPNRDDSLKFV
eukprot:403361737